MPTVMQKERARAGAGLTGAASARTPVALNQAITMVAGATVSGSFVVPEGSWLAAIKAEVATAFTGSPTNINLRIGSAAAGQQVVADTDVKAVGHVACTIVAAFDCIAGITTYFYQLAINGGTNPAGTVNVRVDYFPPNP